MQLRRYRRGDIEAMLRLDILCFEVPFQFDRAMMLEAAEAPNAIVVVAEADAHEMLGFVIVHTQGFQSQTHGYVVTIDVMPSARGAGVGAAMLRDAESQARRLGLSRIRLHVAVSNLGTIAFYERQHYQKLSCEKGFYHQARQDAFLYTKAL